MADTNLLSVTLIGDQEDKKAVDVFFPSASTFAQIQAFATEFLPLLDAVIGGKILEASVNLGITLPGGLKADPEAGSDVHVGGLLTFDVADTEYSHGLYVPSWKFFTGNLVNLAGAGVGAFITEIEDGDGTISPSDRFANDIVVNTKAKKVYRK